MTKILPSQAAAPADDGWDVVRRAAAALALGVLIAQFGPTLLGVIAFVLIPACAHGPSPLLLKGIALALTAAALVAPAVVAGRRAWWIGLPSGLLGAYVVASTMAWSLLTETQNGGFCF